MLALPKNIRIIPSRSFDVNAGIAQLVEHDLAKVGVASSSLVSRSKFTIPRLCGGFFIYTTYKVQPKLRSLYKKN